MALANSKKDTQPKAEVAVKEEPIKVPEVPPHIQSSAKKITVLPDGTIVESF